MKVMVEIQCMFLKIPLKHLWWVLGTCCCNLEILHWFLSILVELMII